MKELVVVFAGGTSCAAFAEPNLYFVPTVGIDDGELTGREDCGAHVTAVSKVANILE